MDSIKRSPALGILVGMIVAGLPVAVVMLA